MLRAQAIAKCLNNWRDDDPSFDRAGLHRNFVRWSIARSMSRLVNGPGLLSMAHASDSNTQAIFPSMVRE
jgi:hypothetical protein